MAIDVEARAPEGIRRRPHGIAHWAGSYDLGMDDQASAIRQMAVEVARTIRTRLLSPAR